MMRNFLIATVFVVASNAAAVNAEPLTLETVLDASLEHYPAIQAAIQKRYRREADLTRAMGAFDLTLDQNALIWADGFYDGKSLDSKIVKPLQSSNCLLYTSPSPRDQRGSRMPSSA